MKLTRNLTPMKAIRKKCLECCCGQRNEVALCHIEDCALWAYRFGKRPDVYPTYETEVSEEQMERLKAMREKRDASNALDTEDSEDVALGEDD